MFRSLVATADVLIKNFRPGTLERWGLAPDALLERNPRLVILRVTGYGQTGPYSAQPGFGTLAEGFSGFAHLVGEADGPPTLANLPLGDGVAGIVEVDDPDLGLMRLANVVPRFSETPGRIRTTGPALGAHTDEVLGELGLSAEEISSLRAEGSV